MGQATVSQRRRAVSVDPALVARAEAALDRLSVHFGPWMNEELGLLYAARARVHTEGLNPDTGEHLSLQVHEVKGLASTFGFPIVTHIAGSLCKLVEDPDTRLGAPMFLVDAHIDAVKAAVKGGIQTDSDPVGHALVTELEQRVKEFAAG